jgi:hypothetical protein
VSTIFEGSQKKMKKVKLLDTGQRNQTIAIVLNSDNKKKKTRNKKLLKKKQKRLKERTYANN